MKSNRDFGTMPDVSKIIAFEEGEMNQEEVVEFFQEMINSGVVWQLQGFYGRTAASLIESGLCHRPVVRGSARN